MKDIFKGLGMDVSLARSLLEQEMNISNKEKYMEAAKEIYDLYSSFVEAGFTEDQAITILLKQMAVIARGGMRE